MAWANARYTKTERSDPNRSVLTEYQYTAAPCTDLGVEGSGGWASLPAAWKEGTAHGTRTGYILQNYSLQPRPQGLAGFALVALQYVYLKPYVACSA